ncbi:MAG: Fic family protein [Paludibacter sp.]|jgi:Fic family protein|nr:Fic family protein [Paludibacter sp.]
MNNDNIKKMLAEWQSLQPLKQPLQHQMDQQFMFDFNYNSNHLEGNTLTYGQTKLLLLFGRVEGEALFRDYEEMKAHNVGLEMMKREALDKQRHLSEIFIRELNSTILAGDFYKTSRDGEYRYKIHTGIYKTRPNSVITPAGAMFDYASPEETPSMMADLISWYRSEEAKHNLSVVELAALFHYRYIRIHPFEDGNGRIARLLVNYILYRFSYPMIVIPTADRNNYLDILSKCDKITGIAPFDGANATIEQIMPFVDYLAQFIEKKLMLAIQFAKGEVKSFSEYHVVEKNSDNQDNNKLANKNVVENVVAKDQENIPKTMSDKRQQLIVNFIKMNNKISASEIAGILKINTRTIQRDLDKLKEKRIIQRIGGDKGGFWEINIS